MRHAAASQAAELQQEKSSTVPEVASASPLAAESTAVRWGPATGAGPLGSDIAATFRGASYTQTVTTEAAVAVTEAAAKTGTSAYETALAGGKHSGFLKNYLGKSPKEINKAINSLQAGNRGINVHLDKVANPSKYVPNWNTLSPSHQQSLINGWQKEIINADEQIQILKEML